MTKHACFQKVGGERSTRREPSTNTQKQTKKSKQSLGVANKCIMQMRFKNKTNKHILESLFATWLNGMKMT